MNNNAKSGRFGKVAVLMGGQSAEREISLKTGQAIFSALQSIGVDAHAVDVGPEIISELADANYDRAFIALHGRGGEDGVIQGALELLGLPYTGSGVLASALCMNKLMTKQVWRAAGLPTPNFVGLQRDSTPNEVIDRLGLPVIVKPALEGSSIGITRVDVATQWAEARQQAARFSGPIMAERWIVGQEYTVAILGDEALPVIRLETPRDFYDYVAKYDATDTLYHCPCGLTNGQELALQELAIAAFKATGAAGWGRVDLMMDKAGSPWLIEINTIPGMTDHSLVPMAAAAAGITFEELVVRILESSEVSK